MQSDRPLAGVSFAVRVTPADSAITARATLDATLTNTGHAPVVVNARMLLNHTGLPGEISVAVEGPSGYRNMRDFHVRPDRLGNQHFKRLAPGESAAQSWTLTSYEGLDTPGDYVITVTYHNEADRAPDGRAVQTGHISASVRIHRRG